MSPYPELFSGLLLVVDEPGRHGLMQGQGGDYVWKILGLSGLTSLHVGVTTLDDFAFAGPREDVHVVVFLGPKGFARYYPDSSVKLGQAHGYPWAYGTSIAIASFHPTEAYDRTKQFSTDDADEDPEEPEEAKSSKGTTRRKNYRFWLGQDLRKACRMLPLNGVLPATDYGIVAYQPLAEVLTALDKARDKQMFFDIETDSQLRITCFSFRYSDSPVTYAVPMFVSYLKEYFHGLENSAKILWALQKAFRYNTVVVHNCLFDLFVTTWRYGLVPPLRVYDTMLSHARLFPEVEKSLGRCVSLYTDYMPYHKNEGVFEPFNQAQYDSLLQYNAKDVSSLAEVWCGIENLTVGLKAQDSVKQINAAVIPYLLAMVQGLRLDSTVLVTLTTEAARKKVQLQRILNLAVGYKLNPNSPKQVAEYVYSPHFGIPQPDLDPTNEKTLLKVQLKAKNPAITTMLAMRGLSKQLGKLKLNLYAPTPLVRVSELNGRLTTGYKLAGTTTYRLASAKLLGRWGDNIQNFEKKLRKIVVPDAGKVFVQVDQSGAEALVVAYLCRRARFRQMFEVGIKSHVYVALHLFIEAWEAHLGKKLSDLLNLPLDQLKAHSDWPELSRAIADSDDWPGEKRYYALAKMVCHASVTEDHEVLTRSGWCPIAEVGDSEILAVDPVTNQANFELPSRWTVYPYNGYLHRLDTNTISFAVTHNHRIPIENNKKLGVKLASELVGKHYGRIPTTCNYDFGSLELRPSFARLLVATQADGCITNWSRGTVEYRFNKHRKCTRIEELLKACEIQFTKAAYAHGLGETQYCYTIHSETLVAHFLGIKRWGSWLLNLTKATAKVIVDELVYWDGSITSHRHRYFSKHKDNVSWMQTLCHLLGLRATIIDWPSSDGTAGYALTINKTSKAAQNTGVIVDTELYTKNVYSPTVSTGFFLVRHRNKVSVTGNSNYGMKAPTFRMNVLQKSEGAVALDSKQAFAFLAGYHSLFPELIAWHNDTIQTVLTTRTLHNLQGYPRTFTGHLDVSQQKEWFAFVPQSTVGTITNKTFTKVYATILTSPEFRDVDILENTHDSVLVQCPRSQAQAVGRMVVAHMAQTLTTPRGESFTMKSEASVGENWYNMEKLRL